MHRIEDRILPQAAANDAGGFGAGGAHQQKLSVAHRERLGEQLDAMMTNMTSLEKLSAAEQ